MNESQAQRTLQLRMDAREQTHGLQAELLRELDGANPSEEQNKLLVKYRSDLAYFDGEIDEWSKQVEADIEAAKKSEAIRRTNRLRNGQVDADEDGIVYRTMSAFARDMLLASPDRAIRAQVDGAVSNDEVDKAKQRLDLLQRTPATTLTSDIAGLTPPQHIAEIMQVIDGSRPLVEAAGRRATLRQLQVTYPQVDATPVVAVQGTQKTEAGNTGMDISMVTKTASTYLGGGNLSWQAIEFSDPNTLDLWFRFAAAHYALLTETDAATVVSASAFLNNIASPIATTATFAQHMTAVGAGYAEVWANSGRTANAIIMAPDRFGYFLGLTSDAFTQFINVDQAGIGPLRVIVSRGLNAGEIIVGDLDGLLVAENAGAPVRLMVSEPAIAGVEVGLVGAFEAAVVDDGAFALITTAS